MLKGMDEWIKNNILNKIQFTKLNELCLLSLLSIIHKNK
jgi:hypothetical protein